MSVYSVDALISLGFVVVALLFWRRTIGRNTTALVVAFGVFCALLLHVVYFVANSLTGSGIDASVLYHLNTGIELAPTGDFARIGIIGGLLLLMASVVTVFTYFLVRRTPPRNFSKARSAIAISLLAGSIYLNPAAADIAAIITEAQKLPNSAENQITPPKNFAVVDELSFDGPKKNFVLLYLESLERSYFDETEFPGLMPNLKALEKEALSLTNISDVSSAGWTIAAMVASQCGMPPVGSGAGVDQFLPGATCLGDLLNDQGFDLHFIGGADLAFAGKGVFYQSHGFDEVDGREELKGSLNDPEYLSGWGLFDDSMYTIAAQRFDALTEKTDPFGLVLLTVDTHHPFGYLSRKCGDDIYEDGSNKFLNAVHCADKMAANFINHVRASPAFKDTVLIVTSDHLAMPNLAWDRLEPLERRNLFMVFDESIKPEIVGKPGTTLDIGPTLLNLIGSRTPALGFGRDLLADAPTLLTGAEPIEAYLGNGRAYINSMWSFPSFRSGMKLELSSDTVILGNRFTKLPALFLLNDDLEVKHLSFAMNSGDTLVERISQLAFDQRFIWIDRCDNTHVLGTNAPPDPERFCAAIGSLGSPDFGVLALLDGEIVPFADIQNHFEGQPPTREYFEAQMVGQLRNLDLAADALVEFKPQGMVGDFAVRSAGRLAGHSWIINRQHGDRVPLERGLTLLGLNVDAEPVKIGHKDTCGYGGEKFDGTPLETDIKTAIAKNENRFGAFVVVAHNSLVCYKIDPDLDEIFAGTPFQKWQDIWYEQPYVAVISGDDKIQEFVGEFQTSLGVELRDFIKPPKQSKQRQLQWLPRVAHAGGSFAGHVNSNSLDALTANASNYDLLELDFSWTSDGHLVCLHDWDQEFITRGEDGTGKARTLAEFNELNRKNPAFENCTLDSLINWLQKNEGVRIVTDFKSDVEKALRFIADEYPDFQHRFVPQVYQPESYRVVRDLGYDDIIWTLYRYSGSVEDILEWLKQMDLLGLTMARAWVERDLPHRARATTGVLSWVHTVNTNEEFDKLVQSGVSEIFSDTLAPGDLVRFQVVSAGFGRGESSITSLDTDRSIDLDRGLNLVGLDRNRTAQILARYDGCEILDTDSAPDPAPFRTTLARSKEHFAALAIVVHDSAICQNVTLKDVLENSGLNNWKEIDFREPFIALIQKDGRSIEYNGLAQSRLETVLTVEINTQ